MRLPIFLLLTTLNNVEIVHSQYCEEGNDFFFAPKKECTTDETVCHNNKKDATEYSYNKEGVYCAGAKGTGTGQCCLKASYCEMEANGTLSPAWKGSTPLKDGTDVRSCLEEKHCKTDQKQYQCKSHVCCEDVTQKVGSVCPPEDKVTHKSCSAVRLKNCDGNTEYCSPKGCCDRFYCATTHTMPAHNPATNNDTLSFVECSNVVQCTSVMPHSFCSKVTAGTKKYCCSIPYAKSFVKNRLLPKLVMEHVEAADVNLKLTEAGEQEFAKKCSTNGDCDEAEYCDEVVPPVDDPNSPYKELPNYTPKMCFPAVIPHVIVLAEFDIHVDAEEQLFGALALLKSNIVSSPREDEKRLQKFSRFFNLYPKRMSYAPRCAGKIFKDPNGIGVKSCTTNSDCESFQNTFCDSETYRNASGFFVNMGFCCQYECSEEARNTSNIADGDKKFTAYANFTKNNAPCNNDNDCYGRGSICINATDKGTPLPKMKKGTTLRLCCTYSAKNDTEVYTCMNGKAATDTHGRYIECKVDKDCNQEEGQKINVESKWNYECAIKRSPTRCCPVSRCKDNATYMRTELDCTTAADCLKQDESPTVKIESRAQCVKYVLQDFPAKSRKCCPLDVAEAQYPYCTNKNCTTMVDCDAAEYCHPSKKRCCKIGTTKLDGTKNERTSACSGTCEDREIFGSKVAQYCVREASDVVTGACYLNPYVIVKERERAVNPVYKTILIISIILFLVFAFLALIMFVNYRSKNFCDKYTPKKKKGKKGKKDKTESTKGSEVSGTSTGGGGTSTGGGGTTGTKDATGTSGASGTTGGDNVSGTGA